MFDKLIPWRSHRSELAKPRYGEDQALTQMRGEFDALWDRFWNEWQMTTRGNGSGGWMRTLDVDDREHEYVIRAELPGLEPEDFDVRVSGNILTLRAEHSEEQTDGNGSRTRRFGRFCESMTLPSEVDSERISAEYHSGILEIHLPKSGDAQHKRIPVKAA